jgi:hypothetical protein
MVEAEIVLDSLNVATGDRITTVRCVFPRIVLAQIVTHRLLHIDQDVDLATLYEAYDEDIPHSLSKNAASSRAVPVTKMLERVKNYPWIPIFRSAMKGMASGEPVDDATQAACIADWQEMMDVCMRNVARIAARGIEKGIANRPLEWFSHIEILLTATEWNNFFLLRDHPAAEVEIRELAQAIRKAMDASQPQALFPGEWHLPYIVGNVSETFGPISAAHCAEISYRSPGDSTYQACMGRFIKLTADNPKHLSPLEHPAVALAKHERHGNLMGWRSLRKDMFGEVESGGDLK